MNKKNFDVVVIGGGPAGYPAAIRAAQNGLSVACVDEWKNRDGSDAFGGTCLNAGCIPSKALLESTELYYRAASEFKQHGIGLNDLAIDVDAMQLRKDKIVKQLTGGIEALFKNNGVTPFSGHARLLQKNHVEVTNKKAEKFVLVAKDVILATGSKPIELPIATFDDQLIVDSWGALDFDAVPNTLGIIGAGVIGLELGSVWQRLGTEVVMLEALEEFLPMVDRKIATEAQRAFKRQGLDIRLGSKVTSAKTNDDGVEVTYEGAKGSKSLKVDKLIICVGRRPFTKGLFEPGVNIALDDRGFIEVNERCSTSLPNVWAVGDVVRGPMLAH
ncbi:MAG: FAD-dependent oxidoreductase, partial [Gammaproteobacteria bacterium]|nr:FAD-dependent oxidoreductase [Gammaproteobacteria bacterium]